MASEASLKANRMLQTIREMEQRLNELRREYPAHLETLTTAEKAEHVRAMYPTRRMVDA